MMRLTSRPAIRPASLVAWRCASLKYAGDGDHGFGDLLAQIGLRSRLHRLQDEPGDLLRREGLAANFHRCVAILRRDDLVREPPEFLADLVQLPSDQALDREHRVLGIGDRLALGGETHQPLTRLREADHRGGGPHAFRVGDDDRLSALHDGDARIGRPEIDADDLAHVLLLATAPRSFANDATRLQRATVTRAGRKTSPCWV